MSQGRAKTVVLGSMAETHQSLESKTAKVVSTIDGVDVVSRHISGPANGKASSTPPLALSSKVDMVEEIAKMVSTTNGSNVVFGRMGGPADGKTLSILPLAPSSKINMVEEINWSLPDSVEGHIISGLESSIAGESSSRGLAVNYRFRRGDRDDVEGVEGGLVLLGSSSGGGLG